MYLGKIFPNTTMVHSGFFANTGMAAVKVFNRDPSEAVPASLQQMAAFPSVQLHPRRPGLSEFSMNFLPLSSLPDVQLLLSTPFYSV